MNLQRSRCLSECRYYPLRNGLFDARLQAVCWQDFAIRESLHSVSNVVRFGQAVHLFGDSYSDKKRDELYRQILASLGI